VHRGATLYLFIDYDAGPCAEQRSWPPESVNQELMMERVHVTRRRVTGTGEQVYPEPLDRRGGTGPGPAQD